jgi:sugar phosphate isomerase/epimerase
MGYAGVEFAGYYGFSPMELRKRLEDLGLKAAGTHAMVETLTGAELERTAEFNKMLGNRFLIVPIVSGKKSRRDWLEFAGRLDEISERLRRFDMLTGYHNHFDEFKTTDGEMPWDIIFGNTKPEVVMQIDTGNALQGGAEAAQFLERYPGRAKSVHLKEYSREDDKALIGDGEVRWEEVFRLCEGAEGTEWYIVEQERYAYSSLECAERNLRRLEEMLV